MSKFIYVYILRSRVDKQFYVGFTHDLRARVGQHNAGEVASTCRRVPLDLVYYEACLTQQDATKREKYLKTAWGKRYIKTRLAAYLTG
jgi:putative endonuclease